MVREDALELGLAEGGIDPTNGPRLAQLHLVRVRVTVRVRARVRVTLSVTGSVTVSVTVRVTVTVTVTVTLTFIPRKRFMSVPGLNRFLHMTWLGLGVGLGLG